MSATEAPPPPPESLPKYLSEGLPKQNSETLRATQAWIDELIAWQTRPVADDDLAEGLNHLTTPQPRTEPC